MSPGSVESADLHRTGGSPPNLESCSFGKVERVPWGEWPSVVHPDHDLPPVVGVHDSQPCPERKGSMRRGQRVSVEGFSGRCPPSVEAGAIIARHHGGGRSWICVNLCGLHRASAQRHARGQHCEGKSKPQRPHGGERPRARDNLEGCSGRTRLGPQNRILHVERTRMLADARTLSFRSRSQAKARYPSRHDGVPRPASGQN